MTELNDVPTYLNELIPYRCPKCGNLRRFATLRELRQHLQAEHSFQMGFIKPHSRACVFKRSNDVISDVSDRNSFHDFERIKVNGKRLNNSVIDVRETSPLLKSFKEETEHLEKELQRAIQAEMKHKTVSMHNLAGNTINADYHSALNTLNNERLKTSHTFPREQPLNCPQIAKSPFVNEQLIHQPFVEKTKPFPFPCVGEHPLNPLNAAMSSLNSHMRTSQMNQWVTTDALHKSQELLQEMETSAENKCQEQRTIIQHLIQDMKMKDEQIELSKKRHSDLKNEREKLLHETESLVQETDDYNSKLQHELVDKHTQLDELNNELTRLRKLSQHELNLKSHDLQQATERVNCLERERDALIQETETLLKQADTDNDKLKQQLKEKEEELNNVNENLKQIRSQQEQMLEKTMDVYQSSEDSRELMQTAIKTKDSQLQQAVQQIENMSGLQRRLVQQSRILTDQADDNTACMKRLLKTKSKQMEDLITQLETLRAEKHRLENNSVSLAEKAETSISAVESLQNMVKQKEHDLRATQGELQHLKTFLKSAADKEKVARQRLETFIEELINRAEKAESELRSMKSQSTDTLHKISGLNTDSAYTIPHEESTQRHSLPSKLHDLPHIPFRRTGEIHMPEAYVEDSNTFVDTILQKNNISQSKTLNSEYDEPTCVEEMDHDYIHHMNELHLQSSGGFVVSEEPLDNANIISEDIYIAGYNAEEEDDDDADGDIESTSINKHIQTSGKHMNKTRKLRSSNHSLRSGSNSKSSEIGKINQTKPPVSKYVQDGAHSQNEHNHAKKQYTSDTGWNTEYTFKKCNNYTSPQNKVSRGLQVGAFLSLQDEHTDGSETDYTESSQDEEQYIEHDSIDIVRGKSTGGKRPATIGKSVNNDNAVNKKIRQPKQKIVTNDNFDATYPVVHKSMENITGDIRDVSEGEVRLRDRRSRSLSPRVMGAQQFLMVPDIVQRRLNRNQQNESVNPQEDIEDFYDGSEYISVIKDSSHHSDGEHQEETEETDGVFNNILDENGILWDDDMATLPDVSDSELDRVSPSGSEAKSSQRNAIQIQAMNRTNSPPSNSVLKSTKDARSRNTIDGSVVSPSTSNVVRLLNNSSRSDRNNQLGNKRTFTGPRSPVRKEVVFTNLSHSNSGRRHGGKSFEDIQKQQFRPIKSPIDNKSSISDKDMTSGGREVHRYMQRSPKVDHYHSSRSSLSPGTRSSNGRISSSRSVTPRSKYETKSTRINVPDKITKYKPLQRSLNDDSALSTYSKPEGNESVEDKINRISSQYSPNRSKTSIGIEGRSSVDDKINAINEKYTKRRHDILKCKGVSTMSDNKQSSPHQRENNSTSDRPMASKLNHISMHSMNTGLSSDQRKSTPYVNNPYGLTQFPYINPNTASPQPLPYIDFAQMAHHMGLNGQPVNGNLNKDGAMLGPQVPPMFPYPPNYMMYPYAMGAFQHQQHHGNSTEKDASESQNKTSISPSLNSDHDNVIAVQTSATCNDTRSAPIESLNVDIPCASFESEHHDTIVNKRSVSANDVSQNRPPDNTLNVNMSNSSKKLDKPVIENQDIACAAPTKVEESSAHNSYENSVEQPQPEQDYSKQELDRVFEEVDQDEKDIDTSPTEHSFIDNEQSEDIQSNMEASEHKLQQISLFHDVDTMESSADLSLPNAFAEEIEDDTSAGYESNSYLDLPGNLTESELDGDTDTESVRREFYEKSKHIHDVLETTKHARGDDVHHRRTTVMSSASSQG